MNSFGTYWLDYWKELDDPKHRYDSDNWYQFYAKELMVYFPDRPVRGLELGCGNGALYGFLRQRFSSYVGIDFSPAMLATFKAKWPAVNLVCADAASLPRFDSKYDLVFSNGLCQYLDEGMLEANLDQVSGLLDCAGIYLIANILDAQLRLFHYANALRSDKDCSWPWAVRRYATVLIRGQGDGLGEWYSRRGICRLAAERGFTCQTFSSMSHEYRFHAVLQKPGTQG